MTVTGNFIVAISEIIILIINISIKLLIKIVFVFCGIEFNCIARLQG